MDRIGVIGGGTMGSGIAQVAAVNGYTVELLDVNENIARQTIESIGQRIDRQVEKRRLSAEEGSAAKQRLLVATGPRSVGECKIVIEAIVEDLEAKAKAIREIECVAAGETIFASNTSSLSITELGKLTGIPERVCGMHFFNPVPLMPLVELVSGEHSRPEHINELAALAENWGKPVVRVQDTPGFIVNRVARPFYLESLRMLEEKKAGCDSIDLIITEIGDFKMGPFALMDLVGIDVNYAVSCSIYEQMGRPARLKPSDIQARLVERQHLGRKTGSGFYDYRHEKRELSYRLDVEPFMLTSREAQAWKNLKMRGKWEIEDESGYILARVLCALMNEAALAEEERVATAEDIDVAMKLGTNYPKGLLAWADELGRDAVGGYLRALNAAVDDNRFAPAHRFMD